MANSGIKVDSSAENRKVGINLAEGTNPSATLDVNGNIKSTSLEVNGTISYDGAQYTKYIITLPSSGWTQGTYGYYWDYSISGLTTSTNLTFDGILYSGSSVGSVTKAEKGLIDKNANYLTAMETQSGKIRFWAHSALTHTVTIQVSKR